MSDARQRIVVGAADMIRRRGLAATSVRDLAKHAQAPLGSTYHYFPGGKEQVAAEAVRLAGDTVSALLSEALAKGAVEGLQKFLATWRMVITSSDFRAGCPVLAVSVEEPPSSGPTAALTAAREVFGTWEAQLRDALRLEGAADDQARQLATLTVAAVEGAVALCRAQRSTEPLDRVAAQLESLIRTSVGG